MFEQVNPSSGQRTTCEVHELSAEHRDQIKAWGQHDVGDNGHFVANALHTAAMRGNTEVVRLLLAHQADITIRQEFGKQSGVDEGGESLSLWEVDPTKVVSILIIYGVSVTLLHAFGKGIHYHIDYRLCSIAWCKVTSHNGLS